MIGREGEAEMEMEMEREGERGKFETESWFRRTWELLEMLEPGVRVRLRNVARIGGKNYNGKVATVIADYGDMYKVTLDKVERDGTVRRGEGMELRVTVSNMEIWDEQVEEELSQELREVRSQFAAQRRSTMMSMIGLDAKPSTSQVKVEELREEDAEESTIAFEDLSPASDEVTLREFHRKQRLKCRLGRYDNAEEIYAKIEREWKEREIVQANCSRSLRDCEAAIRITLLQPSVKHKDGKFRPNPALEVAKIALKQGKAQVKELLAHQLRQFRVKGVEENSVFFQASPGDRRHAHAGKVSFVKRTLVVEDGVGRGQFGTIASHSEEEQLVQIFRWYPATCDQTSAYKILNSQFLPLHIHGRVQRATKTSVMLSENAEPQDNCYRFMLLRITKGPGKSQRARVLEYNGKTRVAVIDGWEWDKSWLEQALDQDDNDLPTVQPTSESFYKLHYVDSSGKTIELPLQGKCSRPAGEGELSLAAAAPGEDLLSGKSLVITHGVGKGQRARIESYDAVRKLVKISDWELTPPDQNSRCAVYECDAFDESMYKLEQTISLKEEEALDKAQQDETQRRKRIRAKMWGAVRVYMMAAEHGETMGKMRKRSSVSAWSYYSSESVTNKVFSLIIGGEKIRVKWTSLVLEGRVVDEQILKTTESRKEEEEEEEESNRRCLVMWKGRILQMPTYSADCTDPDGSVRMPVRVLDVQSKQIIYEGPCDGKELWKSLSEEGEEIEGEEDVFAWRGRRVLQPLKTEDEQGRTVYTLVDDDNGQILYSGLDDDFSSDDNESEEEEEEEEEAKNVSIESDNFLKNIAERAGLSQGISLERGKQLVGQVASKAVELEVEQDVQGGGAVHMVGGQIWKGVSDPALWQSLVEESRPCPGDANKFLWRGMELLQPLRMGEMQKIVSEEGLVVFHGENPNEENDFPTRQQRKKTTAPAEDAALITDMTDFGMYEGSALAGRYSGQGMRTVYSGQWVDHLREGVGTEIFPPYDSRSKNEDGELSFPHYEGELLDGQRHGKGVYMFANGERYQGEFRYNLFDGSGVYFWTDGEYLDCRWRNGFPLGDNIRRRRKFWSRKKKSEGEK
eukprot:767137-Hanusia_phi.AAC.6